MKVNFTRKRKGVLGQTYLELNSEGPACYRCSDCNSELEQIMPNPYIWTCIKCENEFMGPLGKEE